MVNTGAFQNEKGATLSSDRSKIKPVTPTKQQMGINLIPQYVEMEMKDNKSDALMEHNFMTNSDSSHFDLQGNINRRQKKFIENSSREIPIPSFHNTEYVGISSIDTTCESPQIGYLTTSPLITGGVHNHLLTNNHANSSIDIRTAANIPTFSQESPSHLSRSNISPQFMMAPIPNSGLKYIPVIEGLSSLPSDFGSAGMINKAISPQHPDLFLSSSYGTDLPSFGPTANTGVGGIIPTSPRSDVKDFSKPSKPFDHPIGITQTKVVSSPAVGNVSNTKRVTSVTVTPINSYATTSTHDFPPIAVTTAVNTSTASNNTSAKSKTSSTVSNLHKHNSVPKTQPQPHSDDRNLHIDTDEFPSLAESINSLTISSSISPSKVSSSVVCPANQQIGSSVKDGKKLTNDFSTFPSDRIDVLGYSVTTGGSNSTSVIDSSSEASSKSGSRPQSANTNSSKLASRSVSYQQQQTITNGQSVIPSGQVQQFSDDVIRDSTSISLEGKNIHSDHKKFVSSDVNCHERNSGVSVCNSSVSQDNQFGITPLASYILKAKINASNFDSFVVGSDDDLEGLKNRGLDLSVGGFLHQNFFCPFSEKKCRIFEIDAPVPSDYIRFSSNNKTPDFRIEKLSDDTLFFLYYSFPGQVLQILAAGELYKRNWRFHKKLHIWLIPTFLSNMDQESHKIEYFDVKCWEQASKIMIVSKADLESPSVYSQDNKFAVKCGNALLHAIATSKTGNRSQSSTFSKHQESCSITNPPNGNKLPNTAPSASAGINTRNVQNFVPLSSGPMRNVGNINSNVQHNTRNYSSNVVVDSMINSLSSQLPGLSSTLHQLSTANYSKPIVSSSSVHLPMGNYQSSPVTGIKASAFMDHTATNIMPPQMSAVTNIVSENKFFSSYSSKPPPPPPFPPSVSSGNSTVVSSSFVNYNENASRNSSLRSNSDAANSYSNDL